MKVLKPSLFRDVIIHQINNHFIWIVIVYRVILLIPSLINFGCIIDVAKRRRDEQVFLPSKNVKRWYYLEFYKMILIMLTK